MDGINTKKLLVNPDEAANIRLMFEVAQPQSGDITRYFAEQGFCSMAVQQMLADGAAYEFFKKFIVNDAADFKILKRSRAAW